MCTTWLRPPPCPLKISDTMERQLNLFLSEDPTNALAPVARQNLAALAHNKTVRGTGAGNSQGATTGSVSQTLQTFPNTDRLKAQLATLGDESDSGTCDDCGALAEADAPKLGGSNGAASDVPPSMSAAGPGEYGPFTRAWMMWPCFSPSAAMDTW